MSEDAIGTFQGGTLWIAGTDAVDFSTDENAVSDFEGFSFAQVLGLNNMGTFGPEANIVQFPLVSNDWIKKAKGGRNAGDPAVVCGRIPDDPGQVALRAAEKTSYYYNFKLVLNDAVNENYSDTVIYFRALVSAAPINTGGQEDFVTETYTLAIYPGPVIVESEQVTSP